MMFILRSTCARSSCMRGFASATTGLDHTGKTVLVTGGAQGIGRAISLGFARSSATVICADIDEAGGQEVVDLANPLDGDVHFVSSDFSQPSACESLVQAAQELSPHRRVDVLINNVGIQVDNGYPTHKLDEEVWDQVMNVNLKSYFLCAKHCLPAMLSNGAGVIVNIGSVQGHQSQVGIPAYAASKGAILSLTRQMAMDYSSEGVRVVSVSPGTIRTPLVERLVVEDGQTCEELGARYPLGRMGDPDDIASLCSFVASDMGGNITGVDLLCDGGIMAMGGWDQRVGLQGAA